MLKHVQISPLRNRADSVSLRSSTSCASSICGSPEPPTELQRTPSRASSYSSLSEQLPQTTIKVFTNCLKIDIEYKTLGIQWDTTSKEVITQLLRRLKMRHRDPRLFYLSMEVSVRRAGVKTILVLDDDTRPAILQACHPKGESRFCLQLKPGGLIRVHTSALQPSSQYKSLVISEETTSDELLQLLLSCYNSMEPVEQFSIYEVCPGQEYQRKLHPDDIPLRAQAERMRRGETCHFLVRRNPNYIRRRQLLATLNGLANKNSSNNNNNASANKSFDANSTNSSLEDDTSLLDMSIESLTEDIHSLMASDEDEDSVSSTSTSGSSDTSSESSTIGIRRTTSTISVVPKVQQQQQQQQQQKQGQQQLNHTKSEMCPQCRNTFKSCEFCPKNPSMMMMRLQRSNSTSSSGNGNCSATTKTLQMLIPSYSPVYNIREIRTASHSFSALGNDKKLLDIQLNGRFDTSACPRLRPQSVCMTRSTRMLTDGNGNTNTINTNGATQSTNDLNGNNTSMLASAAAMAAASTVGAEIVNNHPAKGLGHFVYL